jgi:hypothetical protein
MIPVICALIVASVALFGFWLAGRRAARERRSKLAAAFAPLLADLERLRSDERPLKGWKDSHDAAVAEFRTHLSKRKRLRFDEATKEYERCRVPIEFDQAFGGSPQLDARRNLSLAIHELQSF